jgi:hypothetical protein
MDPFKEYRQPQPSGTPITPHHRNTRRFKTDTLFARTRKDLHDTPDHRPAGVRSRRPTRSSERLNHVFA